MVETVAADRFGFQCGLCWVDLSVWLSAQGRRSTGGVRPSIEDGALTGVLRFPAAT